MLQVRCLEKRQNANQPEGLGQVARLNQTERHCKMSDEPKEERKNLVTKLTEVMGVIGRIEKSGWNDFHKYHFARESDIVEAIRSHLSERKVFVLPSVTEFRTEQFTRT